MRISVATSFARSGGPFGACSLAGPLIKILGAEPLETLKDHFPNKEAFALLKMFKQGPRGRAPRNLKRSFPKQRESLPCKNPAGGLDSLTRKNLASKANGLDASLGIKLGFWDDLREDDHHLNAPQRGRSSRISVATLGRAGRWAFLGHTPLRGPLPRFWGAETLPTADSKSPSLPDRKGRIPNDLKIVSRQEMFFY